MERFLNLGERFQRIKTKKTKAGTRIYTSEQFNSVVQTLRRKIILLFQDSFLRLGHAETFATEDFAAPDFSHLPSNPATPVHPLPSAPAAKLLRQRIQP